MCGDACTYEYKWTYSQIGFDKNKTTLQHNRETRVWTHGTYILELTLCIVDSPLDARNLTPRYILVLVKLGTYEATHVGASRTIVHLGRRTQQLMVEPEYLDLYTAVAAALRACSLCYTPVTTVTTSHALRGLRRCRRNRCRRTRP